MYSFSRPAKGAYVADNKFIFNGVDLSDVVVVEKITRTLIPPKNVRSVVIPGADGEYIFGSEYGIRTITLDIRIVEATYAEVVAQQLYLAGVLHQRTGKEIHLRDFHSLGLHNVGVLTSEVELERLEDTLSSQLVFSCYQPFNYADEDSIFEVTTATPVLNEGIEVPIKVTLNVTTAITGDVDISTDDGQNLTLKGPFDESSTVIFEDFKLRVNGNLMNTRIDILNSSFITLKTGTTAMTVTGHDTNECLISFKEAKL